MRKILLVSCLLIFWMISSHANDEIQTYRNYDFGYSINYPSNLEAKEIKWVREKMGVTLKNKAGEVTVQAMPAGTSYAKVPFAEYVKIAASVEIQNFNKLLSIEPFVSEYGIKGYQTYWEVVEHQDLDSGDKTETKKVGPIYYFPLKNKRKVGEQPVKTIMISACGLVSQEAEAVAKSFRYLTNFMRFFSQKSRDKLYFVKTNVPFRIELAANATTGYTWNITELDESMFKIESSGYEPEKTDLVGAGGTVYWDILPMKPGLTIIKLDYYRAWEGKSQAVDHFTVRVLVAK